MNNTISQIFMENANNIEQKVAVYFCESGREDILLTYADIVSNAEKWIAAYTKANIQPEEIVLLIFQHSLDMIYAYWATILFGAIPSVIPFQTEKLLPEQYTKELKVLIATTKPAAIVTYPEFRSVVQAAMDDNGSVRAILAGPYPEIEKEHTESAILGVDRQSNDIAILQHSSGSTGLQKGVALSHRAILDHISDYSSVLHISNKDVIVSWLPLYHDMGLIAGYLLPLLTRIPLVLLSPFDWVRAPALLHKKISAYKGTLSWLPNFAFEFCAQKIRDSDMEGIDLSSWRAVINCSEVVHPESHNKFITRFASYGLDESAIQTCYAMAENVFAVTQSTLGSSPVAIEVDKEVFRSEKKVVPPTAEKNIAKLLSSGVPLPNNKIRIVSDAGLDLPEKHVGNILIKSRTMLDEYYNRPLETKEAFDHDWYKTGDLGFRIGRELFVTGRKKEIIIVGGKNIFPQDIETVVFEVQRITPGRAIAFGIYNDKKGTEDVIVVAETNFHEEDQNRAIEREIKELVNRKSAVSIRIVQLVPPKWLIKTSSGKISRYANREKYIAEFAK